MPFRSMEWPFTFHVGIPEIRKNSADEEADGDGPWVGDDKVI